jgi:hypothetical protein
VNSGEEIYNRAIITGQTPDGQPVRQSRGTAPFAAGTIEDVDTTPAASGWAGTPTPTFNGGTNTWTWSPTTPGQAISATIAGPGYVSTDPPAKFRAGRRYRLTWAPFIGSGGAGSRTVNVTVGATAEGTGQIVIVGLGTPALVVDFESQQDYSALPVKLTLAATSGVGNVSWQGSNPYAVGFHYDDLPNRRGFRRTKILPVQNALPADNAAAQAIAGTWLTGHKSTPFKGSVVAVGAGSVRDVLTGEDVPPERLLLDVGELVRFSDRTDPDTGGHGRDGRIAAVSYTPATDQASVTVDNTRSNFEALMNRFDLLAGS